MRVVWALRFVTGLIVAWMLYLPHSTYAQHAWRPCDIGSANCVYDFVGDDEASSPWTTLASRGISKTLTGVNSPTTTTETLVQGHKALTFNGTNQYGTVNTTTLIRSVYLVVKVNADSFTSTARCAWAQSGGTGPTNLRAIQGCPEGGVAVNKASGCVWLPSDAVSTCTPESFVQGNSTFGIQKWEVNLVSAGNYNMTLTSNGVVAGTASTKAGTLPTPTNTYIGANVFQGATVNWCNCDIVEIAAFDAVLSASDDLLMMNYLQQQYFPGMSSLDGCYFLGFDSAHTDFLEAQSSTDCKASTWTRRSLGQAMVGPSIGTYAGQLRDPSFAIGTDGNWHAVATNCQNAKQNICFSVLTSAGPGPGGAWQYSNSPVCSASADTNPQCWAPEYFTDLDGQIYVFYSWQPTYAADGNAQHFTTYVKQPTNAAQTTWGSGTQLTLSGNPCSWYIDVAPWRVGATYYLALVADGCGANQIDIFTASSITGTWTWQRTLGFSNVYYEGPSVVRLSNGSCIMYLDHAVIASNSEYWYATSANCTFSDVSATTALLTTAVAYPNYTTGALQHGTVVRIVGAGNTTAQAKPQPWNAWRELWARR